MRQAAADSERDACAIPRQASLDCSSLLYVRTKYAYATDSISTYHVIAMNYVLDVANALYELVEMQLPKHERGRVAGTW